MDSSNLAHFAFSFLIPIGWASILLPITRPFFGSWSRFLFWVLLLSLAVICGKEFIDSDASINDIVADILGFFFGAGVISSQFLRRKKALREVQERDVSGQKISLRGTMSLIEKVERRSANFYKMAAEQLPSARASGICSLLARDANKRANHVAFTLAGWKAKEELPELTLAIERAFSSEHIFSLSFSPTFTPKEVMLIALEHEKKKFSLFSKLEDAFHEEWKLMRLGKVLNELSKEIKKLEMCVLEFEREEKSSS